jgi:hypothetical protein
LNFNSLAQLQGFPDFIEVRLSPSWINLTEHKDYTILLKRSFSLEWRMYR